MMQLTNRLQTIANELSPSESCADIGTDHGYLPLYLYEENPERKIIFSDVSEGSLNKAAENCKTAYPDVDFDLRLGSGLRVLEPGEVDSVVMAGMGGNLMAELILDDVEKSWTYKKFILQPRSHIGRIRFHLLYNSFSIINEQLVREGGFIWPIITAVPKEIAIPSKVDEDDIEFEYPRSLLDFRNDLTGEYLDNALQIETQKYEGMQKSDKLTARQRIRQEYRIQYLGILIKELAAK